MTASLESDPGLGGEQPPLSLSTAAARNLASTTKSVPQMQEISSRWLLRLLPWVEVKGGTYRVNRRLTYPVGDGRIDFVSTGARVRLIPRELGELPLLRGFDDLEVLAELADRFTQREFQPGEVIALSGHRADQLVLIAHGKVERLGTGKYGGQTMLGMQSDGEFFGQQALLEPDAVWEFTVRAVTWCIVLTLSHQEFQELTGQSQTLHDHVERFQSGNDRGQNKYGESAIDMAAGHAGEPVLPGTFVDYDPGPREYELSVAQTVLRVHTRVADLYNGPMDQMEQQLRLTIEAIRERQEHEIINNPDFGLLHNADLKQRIHPRTGPPTPDDLDNLLSRRRSSRFFLSHPRTIAAFGRECNRRGIYPASIDLDGQSVLSWRGVPLLPCDKIPITKALTSHILVLRTGQQDQGVVGLHQTGIPDEYQPGLSVRFMGIDEKAIMNYLVSAYYCAAVLVPDALGILEHVEIGHTTDR